MTPGINDMRARVKHIQRVMLFSFILITFSIVASADELYVSSEFLPARTFTTAIEGPVCDADGTFYAVNYQYTGSVASVTPDGAISIFANLPNGGQGNGMRIDSRDRFFIADKTGHNIIIIDEAKGICDVFIHEPDMNEPNDLAITSGDILFASDPDWSKVNGKIWRINPDGTAVCLEDSMGTTNGIEVSPDETTLYVNESMEARIWAYDLSADGAISNKRLFASFDSNYLDGMRCDVEGNLYVARYGHGTIAKLSPAGEIIREITLAGERPCNVAFGGPDGCTCYVTIAERGNVETFQVERPGRSWQMIQDREPVMVAESPTPGTIGLVGNYPNPFNPATTIEFTLAESAPVQIRIFSSTGQTVATLADGVLTSGRHTVIWNAADMPGGVYLYSVESGNKRRTGKMVLTK